MSGDQGAVDLFRRVPDFRRLWTAGAISQLGDRVSLLALPLLALTVLHASVLAVSLLRTSQSLAALAIGLPAGVWCDRLRRRPVLITADLGRAVLFASVPIAAALHLLGLVQLYVVVFTAGALTVFFGVANQSILPSLLPRADLVAGNARLQINQSVAATVGPTIGGWLVQFLSAPVAVLLDALSYLWSAAWLASIRTPEPKSDRTADRALLRDIAAGLRFVFGHPIVRALALSGTTVFLFQSMYDAIGTVFLVRDVGLSPGLIGSVSGVAMLAAVLASVLAGRIVGRLGDARALRWAGVVMGVGMLAMALTRSGWWLTWFVLGDAVLGFGIIVAGVVETSYCQTVCPPELLGRMNATLRFLMWGMVPIGSVLGGLLATEFGERPVVWLAGAGTLAAVLWLVCSPVRSGRRLPYES
ncbi:MAG TPA: MFS transporter [Pseudonocardiaceae bacterium]|jgi:MFS family permease|nr:MFS transporter [Pseudonocardiaceae bacterium]